MKKREQKRARVQALPAGRHHLRGERLLEMRTLRGMTQTDLAYRADVKAASVVSDLENGKGDLTGDTLARLALALECSSDFLLGLSDEPGRR